MDVSAQQRSLPCYRWYSGLLKNLAAYQLLNSLSELDKACDAPAATGIPRAFQRNGGG
jgi:hypothetical protein